MNTQLPNLMTVREVADYLDVSPDTVRLMARKKELEGIKVRSDWRFTVETVAAFVTNGGTGQ